MSARLLGGASLLDLRSAAGALAVARGLLVWIGLQVLRFAPLGLLAVFALPDREGRISRAPPRGPAGGRGRSRPGVPGARRPRRLLDARPVGAPAARRRDPARRLGRARLAAGLLVAPLLPAEARGPGDARPPLRSRPRGARPGGAARDRRGAVHLFCGQAPPGEPLPWPGPAQGPAGRDAHRAPVFAGARPARRLGRLGRAQGAHLREPARGWRLGSGDRPGPGDRTLAQRDRVDARRHRPGAAVRLGAAPPPRSAHGAAAAARHAGAPRGRRAAGRPRPSPRPAFRPVALPRSRAGEPHLRPGGDAAWPGRAPRVGRGGQRGVARRGLRPRRPPPRRFSRRRPRATPGSASRSRPPSPSPASVPGRARRSRRIAPPCSPSASCSGTRDSRQRWGRSWTTSVPGSPGASGSARRCGAGRTGRATSP